MLDEAGRLRGQHPRSPDAIHLATANAAGAALTAFVSYDERLARTAEEMGLPVIQPD